MKILSSISFLAIVFTSTLSLGSESCLGLYSTSSLSISSQTNAQSRYDSHLQTIIKLLRANSGNGYTLAKYVTSETKTILDLVAKFIQEKPATASADQEKVIKSYSEQRDIFLALFAAVEKKSDNSGFLFKRKMSDDELAKQLSTAFSTLQGSERKTDEIVTSIEAEIGEGRRYEVSLREEREALKKTIDALMTDQYVYLSPEARSEIFSFIVPHLMSIHESLDMSLQLLKSHLTTLTTRLSTVAALETEVNQTRFNLVPLLSMSTNKNMKELLRLIQTDKSKEQKCKIQNVCFDRELKTGETVFVYAWYTHGEAYKGRVEGVFPDGKYSILVESNSPGSYKVPRKRIGILDSSLEIDGVKVGNTARYKDGTSVLVVAFIPNTKLVMVRSLRTQKYWVVKRSTITRN